MKPITIEVLRKLNPTPENPVELVYIKGLCECVPDFMSTMKVIHIHKGEFVYIDRDSELGVDSIRTFEYFTLKPKKVKRWVNLYKDENEHFRVWGAVKNSKKQASRSATNDRIACVEIEVDEGVL